MSIQIKNISKAYGSFQALNQINFDIQTGELVALLGPSGSGKTSLLRIIAGLETADHGSILLNGENITQASVRDRNVGFVFQHYALFRHMSVFENIAYGLKVRPRKIRPSSGEIREKVERLLKLVKLEAFANRFPSQLSGGQRQRVALARALAVEPKVLLLDEPFGALDAKVRKDLRRWIRKLHDDFQITSVFVTHDQEEAMDVADRIVVMNEGKVEQIGTPEQVYAEPKNPFVYDFIGNVNLFKGRLQNGKLKHGLLEVKLPEYGKEKNIEAVGYARPHELAIGREPDTDGVLADITHIHFAGATIKLELNRKDTGESLEAELMTDHFQSLQLKKGEEVYVKPKQLKVFFANKSV